MKTKPTPQRVADTLATLLSTKEVARRLRVSDRTAWDLINRRGLPAVRFGRSVRVRETALNDWVKAHEVPQ